MKIFCIVGRKISRILIFSLFANNNQNLLKENKKPQHIKIFTPEKMNKLQHRQICNNGESYQQNGWMALEFQKKDMLDRLNDKHWL